MAWSGGGGQFYVLLACLMLRIRREEEIWSHEMPCEEAIPKAEGYRITPENIISASSDPPFLLGHVITRHTHSG